MAAAGGIYASVEDLSKWMLVQLNSGKYGTDLSNELFSNRRQREMWQPYTTINFTHDPYPRNDQHFTAYGLGWKLNDRKGKIIVSHTGGLPGMLSKTILVPELDLGIVVLTNSLPGGYAYYSVPEVILDSYFDLEPFDWVTQLAKQAEATSSESDSVATAVWNIVEEKNPSPIAIDQYVGTYTDDWFGEVEISKQGDHLYFTSKKSPKLSGPMYFYKATTFAVKWDYQDMNADAFATFTVDEEGNGTGISMKGISPNIDFSFDFQDLDFKRKE